MISITLDTDWVVPEILEDTMELLASYEQTGTVCCTSRYSASLLGDHEVALHPNYFDRNYTEEEHVARMLDMYPESIGVRGHGLYINGRLLTDVYPKYGLRYTSDYAMPYMEGIRPFQIIELVQLPIFFADMTWLRLKKVKIAAMPPSECKFDNNSLYVFCFHPIHIFLNTPTVDYYTSAKRYYQDYHSLKLLRQSGEFGVRDALVAFLEKMKNRKIRSCTLKYIYENFK
jgi:hypothetical protein